MELLRRNAHLAAEAELPAVGEAGGDVDVHRRAVDLVDKAVGRGLVLGHDAIAVVRRVMLDMRDGRIQIIYDRDGENVIEKFCVEVELRCRRAGNDLRRGFVEPQLDGDKARFSTLVDKRREAGLVPVELRLDEAAAEIIPGTAATELDFDTEFLDYILAVAVVDDLDAAIAHVQHHSTHHSDCIVTENQAAADRFVDEVDSAAVYVNVSTRFTDGGEFGLGCEMGISTQKLHARGPMGLDELSTYKYVITGSGQIR